MLNFHTKITKIAKKETPETSTRRKTTTSTICILLYADCSATYHASEKRLRPMRYYLS